MIKQDLLLHPSSRATLLSEKMLFKYNIYSSYLTWVSPKIKLHFQNIGKYSQHTAVLCNISYFLTLRKLKISWCQDTFSKVSKSSHLPHQLLTPLFVSSFVSVAYFLPSISVSTEVLQCDANQNGFPVLTDPPVMA